MNAKISLITVLVLLTSVVMISCHPIDILYQLTDSSERQLMKRLAEYLTNDYSDESSSSSYSNAVHTRGVTANQEKCRLPMKRGLCRALLPRWRYDPITRTCSEFKFGGCDGNANNFKSRSECMEQCAGV
ncbi:CLUMA_CG004363, isoform A [Clunio marinus]|uniref:CLUMA_CG004363, isoform A n=1 Tax=Clunio marinus TaxID=568069 RepID=A0A1J1HVX5_9DIPT|nr:CLUMA_CG004363, isoform A [Clunio marinus]